MKKLRNYTMLNMVQMANYARLDENKNKSSLELIKEFNIKYPELSSEEQFKNLCTALKLTPEQLINLLKTPKP